MRSAGCVYNDIVDRDLDAQVERTRLRPLASGRVSLTGAWAAAGRAEPDRPRRAAPARAHRAARRAGQPRAGRRLSVHEADHLVAAGLARPGLLLGALVGWPAVTGEIERAGAAALRRLDLLGDRLRHDLRAAGPRGRRAGRGQILGAGARPACAARHRDLLSRSRCCSGRRRSARCGSNGSPCSRCCRWRCTCSGRSRR